MNARRFNNFGELYRAALAESNPELKQKLLAHVKNALDLWAQADGKHSDAAPGAPKLPVRVNRTSAHRVA